MYICLKCGGAFDSPNVEKDTSRYFSDEAPVYEASCPICGSEYFSEAEKCGLCGEWVESLTDWDMCKDCLSEAKMEVEIRLRNATTKARALWRLAMEA